ncbi:hypothetical protein [Legionella brunensis]|uniref:Uncharacterized protein n=1 Tax=Legionella brunensis TaxID=29422 RepID=A0A0W0S3L0_9GAMM|nr:hypothetical protein [Legionella brunensis]KTC78030.1 hypothetical protein Lbru_2322 [Legionella brunensis]
MDTFITLGITLFAELLAFLLLIIRKIPKNHIINWIFFIIGLNLLTNPLAQMFYSSLKILNIPGLDWLITEILVILGEAVLIYGIMRQSFQRALLYSMLLNVTSILVGALLCWSNILPWCY